MITIPEGVAESTVAEGQIPADVAEIVGDQEELEARPYLISFAKYNTKLCEVEHLDLARAKRAINTLRSIGTKVRSRADFQRNAIERTPITKNGEYMKLFKGLAEDVELTEIKISDKARIFCFDIESERTFFVVAITQNHFEVGKVRRK